MARGWKAPDRASSQSPENPVPGPQDATNPIRAYFDGITEGPGIWKWSHYFDIYHRHLSKFIGRPVTVVEIGVYSGGSLPMWRHYFGSGCHVHGVDIQPECKVYENGYTTIHIGDQSSREFWKGFRERVPQVDILIDDGGHLAEQQIVTLEEMLPALKPGGVYICEDICCARNGFADFASSMALGLNAYDPIMDASGSASRSTAFQDSVHSVHSYPFVLVVEKSERPTGSFMSVKRGTKWQPFL